MTVIDAGVVIAPKGPSGARARVPEPAAAPGAANKPSRWSRRWPWLLVLAVGALYIVVGIWMMYGIDYAIGDALARGAGARSIVHSRDQHVMGIGVYWMPIPTLVQAPAMAVFSRLGQPELTIPVMTAVAGALTVLPIVAAGRALGLRDPISAFIALLYALNPYTIFFAASGMSEPWTALFLAWSMLLYIRWTKDRRARDLGALGLVLALTLLTKYEILGFIPPLVVLVAAQAPRGRRLATAMTVALPSAFAFVVWFLISVVITGQTPFDVVFGASNGLRLNNEGWLPEDRTVETSVRYVLRLILLVAPGTLLLAAMSGVVGDLLRLVVLLAKRGRASVDRPMIVAGVLLPFAVFPAQVGFFLLRGSTFGNPRYFTPLILATTFLALVVAARARGYVQALLVPITAAACIVGFVTGFATLSNPKASKIESETYVVDRLMGRMPRLDPTTALKKFETLTDYMDAHMGPDDLAALDSAVAHPMALLTSKPKQVVTDRDKDSEQLTARNPMLFTWIVVATDGGLKSATNSSLQQGLSNPPTGMRWELAAEGPTGQEWPMGSISLYHLVDATSPGPTSNEPSPSTLPS